MLQPSTLKFLKDLKKNNNKPWFEKHRPAYERARKDFSDFIQDILNAHVKKDPNLKDLTAKNCLYRINRDIRFSKDKTPYKTNFAASLDKGGKQSGLAGYYFQLEPGRSFFGGGIWMPPTDRLKKIRQEIDYCFDEFNGILNNKKFKLLYPELYKGESVQLSRVPQGFEKENPAAEYLRFKSWLVLKELTDEDVLAPGLLKKTLSGFEALQPFLQFLNRAAEE
ncbi:MAG TPA: DUF2461 domain-containing protein [Chitinophagaceae bacterium]|nr:DUF2461 domain-containing protein [Chitinophagaceae bacterium]